LSRQSNKNAIQQESNKKIQSRKKIKRENPKSAAQTEKGFRPAGLEKGWK
jgi:hypothetical protein